MSEVFPPLSSIAELKAQALHEFAPARRCAVLGAGVSGRAAARLLLRLGREVLLFDDRDGSGNQEVRDLIAQGATCRWGSSGSASGALSGVQAVILSPGFPLDHPLRQEGRRLGIPEIPELELGWMHSGRSRHIAITGTNGKTTVTMLVRHILESAGLKALEAGNIGLALCDAVERAGADLDQTIFSLEASSFQLEGCRFFNPEVAILLNITPDHLDRHRSMEEYARAKAQVTARQSPAETLVANQDDTHCLQIARQSKARTLLFSLDREVEQGAWLDHDRLTLNLPRAKPVTLGTLGELPLFGLHNVANFLAGACAASAMGVPGKAIAAAIATFRGGPHRLEHIATIGDVQYFNDSKATNIDAMVKAVASFSAPIHLIAGGRDKDSPFEMVIPEIEGAVVQAYLIGEASDKIQSAWRGSIETLPCETLERALEEASIRAQSGEIILLAPGCASFDQFNSYAHRGDVFRKWVEAREAAARTETAPERS